MAPSAHGPWRTVYIPVVPPLYLITAYSAYTMFIIVYLCLWGQDVVGYKDCQREP